MTSERSNAILLFTSYFSKDETGTVKPLSTADWNSLAGWLVTRKLNPEDLLTGNDSLNEWQHPTISKERLFSLLERKSSLALALGKWTNAGIWIVNRGEAAYPAKILQRLKSGAPPILFGIGDPNLLNGRYIGIVGSRNAGEVDKALTIAIAGRIVSQGYGIVSGGAKGIDDSAMMGALETGGTCAAALSDSLLKRSLSATLRKYIISQKLVLFSAANPEAGFSVGNAMGRNKLIYTLSAAAIVIKSDSSGGTWTGARENLSKGWVPLHIVSASDRSGNSQLHKAGAAWLPQLEEIRVEELIKVTPEVKPEADLFSAQEEE